MSMHEIERRHRVADQIAAQAAAQAIRLFHDRDTLCIELKGLQDWVSDADHSIERAIRTALLDDFPDDSILGEEQAAIEGNSGFRWVIDPIDGTSNFVNGLPGWCIVIACVHKEQSVIGVIVDPVVGETWSGCRGRGATLNGKPLSASSATSLADGAVAVGHNTRITPAHTLALIEALLANKGMFYRNGSGALMLAYVAAGRLIGYCETHMHPWDCVAALLLIEEAGGRVQSFSMEAMLARGGEVVAGAPGTFGELSRLTEDAYR